MTPKEIKSKGETYRQKFQAMILSYNVKQAELLTNGQKQFSNYTTEYVQKIIKENLNVNVEKEKSTAQEFIDASNNYLKTATKLKDETRFPLRNASDVVKNALGEAKNQRAYNFLSLAKDFNKITAEFESAFQIGDLDYANSLIDAILLKEPDPLNHSQFSNEEVTFYGKVKELKLKQEKASGIFDLDGAIQDFTKLIKDGSAYHSALSSGVIQYYDQDTVRSMNQNQVASLIDDINNSSEHWQS
jgi:hypothetical protein